MSSRRLRRWLVATATIVAVTAGGVGRSVSPSASRSGADPRSAGIILVASGAHGLQAVIPTRIGPAFGYERGVRVKLPGLFATAAAVRFAGAVARRMGFLRPQRSPLPVALRARFRPLRAPPVLLLG